MGTKWAAGHVFETDKRYQKHLSLAPLGETYTAMVVSDA
jgi:hypothetical protein